MAKMETTHRYYLSKIINEMLAQYPVIPSQTIIDAVTDSVSKSYTVLDDEIFGKYIEIKIDLIIKEV